MNQKLLYLIAILSLVSIIETGCLKTDYPFKSNSTSIKTNNPNNPRNPTGKIIKEIPLTTRSNVLSLITGKIYYLDINKGSDTRGNGSSSKPWKTIPKVQTVLQAGDGVILKGGNYSKFAASVSNVPGYANWVVYINAAGETPILPSLTIVNSSLKSMHLIFYGITFAPAWVDPGSVDPQDPNSNQNSYNKTGTPVYLYYTNYVSLYNCELIGTNKHLTLSGVYLTSCQNTFIERCEIHRVSLPITILNSNYTTVRYSHLHNVTQSFVDDGGGSQYILIEGNHGHDSNYSTSEDYCPRASGQNYHGSFVAFRDSNITVRNNIFHDGCTSSGFMFYTGAVAHYDNILIENNLLYDPHNEYVMIVNLLGDNVVLRNNIFIGRGDLNDTTIYRYNEAFVIISTASGNDGSGLSLYNNVFIGRTVYTVSTASQGNNFYYYLNNDTGSINSYTAYPNHKTFFDSGFFNGQLVVAFAHGQTLDLTPAANSPLINFGDPNHQPSDSLGTLDSSGFIMKDGAARDSDHHSAGCYEIN